MLRQLMLAGVASALFVSPSFALEGKVLGVLDGDTIDVLSSNKEVVRVRLASIDAPENGMPYGNVAKKALSDLVSGQQVSVTEDTKDAYGRTIGLVSTSINVNAKMVQDGYAWAYCESKAQQARCKYLNPRDNSFMDLMEGARNQHVGLWSQSEPQAPWQWRYEQRHHNVQTATCSTFKTCQEAMDALGAGNTKIDGNHDGVPCESTLCVKK